MRLRTFAVSILATFLIGILTFGVFTQGGEGAEPPATEWMQTYGGANPDIARSVVQTSDSGYLMAGDTMSLGVGAQDFWLVKVDSYGNHEWNKTYGGADADIPFSLVETGDEGYVVAGRTRSFGAGAVDAWLVKTDLGGNHEWNKTYGGPRADVAHAVIQTSDGGYALAGYTQSFGAVGQDLWLVKTDIEGNLEWRTQYGGAGDEDARGVVETSDGGYALAGFTTSFGAGGEDFWLVKVDSYGNHEWNKTYGGADADMAFSMVTTGDGGYALGGRTQSFGAGRRDFWLVKVDSYGNHEWNKTYGGASNDPAHSIVETNVVATGDGYALAGFTTSFGAGGQDGWLIKTDIDGNMEWNKTYGGSNNDVLHSMVATEDGGYALAGFTTSFGAGGEDFWLVKVSGPPEHTLTIHSLPAGITFSVGSLSFSTPWNETYQEGTSVSFEAPEVHIEGDAKYYWNQWSDGNASRSRTIAITTNITLTALFTGPYYEISINSSPITGIPFSINGIPHSTHYSAWLIESYYMVEMPEESNGYVWSHWLEDGDTNRIKTVVLQARTIYTAVYTIPVGGNAIGIESGHLRFWIASVSTITVVLAASKIYLRHESEK